MAEIFFTLDDARVALRDLWRSGGSLGSVHSLGALHEGHGRVITLAASENDHCVVTIYPNEAQLAPGMHYEYDPEADIRFAIDHGATHVIAPGRGSMYPSNYLTFLDQGECWRRLDGSVLPFMFRGMITMCIRWMSFVRPTRVYWGLKDIGQTLLVRRAASDLMLDTEIREVPCVRYTSGIPISSRLMSLDRESLEELAGVYRVLREGLAAVSAGETRADEIRRIVHAGLDTLPIERFRPHYVKIADANDFTEPNKVGLPFVLHCAVTNGTINHFDGFLVREPGDLSDPKALWLESKWP
ncbi:pantoate--beta-alanine ligase [Rhodospirillum sp. A1_3_36]|uniref:pantoate--beta-alanine ligase n=1 Tax=Rhodospirillum sp. A1_3_36 TaxID=3391666 RepID=UPI0039A58023